MMADDNATFETDVGIPTLSVLDFDNVYVIRALESIANSLSVGYSTNMIVRTVFGPQCVSKGSHYLHKNSVFVKFDNYLRCAKTELSVVSIFRLISDEQDKYETKERVCMDIDQAQRFWQFLVHNGMVETTRIENENLTYNS